VDSTRITWGSDKFSSRPPSRPGTGTSESASFQSFEEQDEPEQPEPTDEITSQYKLDPETRTWLPIQEPERPKPITDMAPQPPTGGSTTTTVMNIDHEGKSYLKKPEPFNGNR
jgi:hypothetical protein